MDAAAGSHRLQAGEVPSPMKSRVTRRAPTVDRTSESTWFIDRVGRLMRYTRMNPNFHFAVAFLDLDDFKPINDRLGHKAGDLVLQRIAQRLKFRMKTGDVAARYGGDELCCSS